jgi:NAD+ synthase (glutamine-hydrolysing)
MRLALAQIDSIVGDLDANRAKVEDYLDRARDARADLVIFPELVLTGYPPEDLLLRPGFIRAARQSLEELAKEVKDVTVIVGAPHFDVDLYNAAFVLDEGEVKAIWRKRFLPNYGVFDEDRYFASGNGSEGFLLRVSETLVGVTICEDIWQPGPPTTELALAGAQLVVNLSASPFYVGKVEEREEMLRTRARDNSCFIAFTNAVGGQDELLFDGHSVVLSDDGHVLARAPGFEEHLLLVDLDPEESIGRRLSDGRGRALKRVQPSAPGAIIELGEAYSQTEKLPAEIEPVTPHIEQMLRALELGLGDYVFKNGFRDVVIGVSGGIDSAVTAAIAARTLGPEHVYCVSMPSRYSSADTRSDAQQLADNLGADFREIAIEPVVGEMTHALANSFIGRDVDVTEENVQARVRGNLLMALSNKFGWLVVATGNKSEMAMGFATLYGDMAGGFALLKDVFKTDVFNLARHINEKAGREVIPVSTIERPPSAELRDGQLDEQSLPPYDVLDPLLEAYIERDLSHTELLEEGFSEEVLDRVIRGIDRAEYKRRQAPPGVKLRPKAFGRDRRTPITNRWRD